MIELLRVIWCWRDHYALSDLLSDNFFSLPKQGIAIDFSCISATFHVYFLHSPFDNYMRECVYLTSSALHLIILGYPLYSR